MCDRWHVQQPFWTILDSTCMSMPVQVLQSWSLTAILYSILLYTLAFETLLQPSRSGWFEWLYNSACYVSWTLIIELFNTVIQNCSPSTVVNVIASWSVRETMITDDMMRIQQRQDVICIRSVHDVIGQPWKRLLPRTVTSTSRTIAIYGMRTSRSTYDISHPEIMYTYGVIDGDISW